MKSHVMCITNGFLAVGLLAALAMTGCTGGSTGSSAGTPPLGNVSPALVTSQYVQRVVIVVQENRSFDDFFTTFPGAVGATQGLMKTPSGDQYIQLQSEPSTR